MIPLILVNCWYIMYLLYFASSNNVLTLAVWQTVWPSSNLTLNTLYPKLYKAEGKQVINTIILAGLFTPTIFCTALF